LPFCKKTAQWWKKHRVLVVNYFYLYPKILQNMDFKNKKLLITGGTGSFGNAVLRKLLNAGLDEIRVFSRDEKKQDDMRKALNNPIVKFYIGDVRDSRAVDQVVKGVDFVFHAAALKQVPSCEFFPVEAVRTNILGAENVMIAAEKYDVERLVVQRPLWRK